MASRKPVTLHRLREMHAHGEKIAMLTCYDAIFARVLDAAGVDVLLVGDSLGMVLQGHPSTLPVIDRRDGLSHGMRRCAATARHGSSPTCLSAAITNRLEQALRNAARLMQAGAHMVKTRGRRLDRPHRTAAWSSAAFPSVRTWASRRSRCMRWAATACRARDEARGPRAAPATQPSSPPPAPRCLVIEMVPAAIARELTQRAADAGDRHRRRRRLQRPGAGAARHARPDARGPATVRAQLSRRQRRCSRPPCAAMWRRSKTARFRTTRSTVI